MDQIMWSYEDAIAFGDASDWSETQTISVQQKSTPTPTPTPTSGIFSLNQESIMTGAGIATALLGISIGTLAYSKRRKNKTARAAKPQTDATT